MAAVYVIDFTDPSQIGGPTFTIQPGQLDGPGSSVTHSSLRLYGMGALAYGEGVNENFVHLLENFSSPEGTNPGEPDPALVEPPYLRGQLWYNTTAEKLYVYDGSVWKSSGGVVVGAAAPSAPLEGDLWYDTTIEQLKVFRNTAWTSVAERYLLLDGTSAMAGNLNMDGNQVVNLGTPASANDAATMDYVDTEVSNALSTVGTNYYDMTTADATFVDVAGDTMTGALTLSGAPTIDLHAATKKYVDDEIQALLGGGGSVTVINPSTPKDGDIQLPGGGIIQIREGGVWRQVYPAVYT